VATATEVSLELAFCDGAVSLGTTGSSADAWQLDANTANAANKISH
jgi:hypothetical protein